LKTPRPNNWQQDGLWNQVEDHGAEEYEGEELDYSAEDIEFEQGLLHFSFQLSCLFH
jgi:hypothetical protein